MQWNWVCAAACLASVAASAVADDDMPPPVAAAEPLDIDALVRKGEALIQVVLANHVDPPTRQEMWLTGTKAVFESVPGTSPAGLSARISQITKPEEFRAFLRQAWFQELRGRSGADRRELDRPGRKFARQRRQIGDCQQPLGWWKLGLLQNTGHGSLMC
jgi:hypothetical protein